VKSSPGFVKVRLAIQGYRHEERLVTTELSPGFHVFLGEQWNVRKGVVANYGYVTDVNAVQPSLWLCRTKVRLRPFSLSGSNISNGTEANTMLSAIQAFRFLKAGLNQRAHHHSLL
jgi:hypothetical protein